VNRLHLLLVPWLGLAGCTGGGPADADVVPVDSDTSATVELGSGQTDWETVASTDGRTELIYGPQGGYHIWGRARFQGFQPDVDVSFTVTRVDDGMVLHAPNPARRWIADGVRRGLLDLGGGTYATDAELVILSIRCTDEVVGRRIRWEVQVRERATGRTATETKEITVVDEVTSPACGIRG
jgi:hypothetical protein